jgi:multidrug resistance efflux pump
MINNYSLGVIAILSAGAASCGRAWSDPSQRAEKGYQGVVEFEDRQLAFEVLGRVRSVAVRRGDLVKAGQVLLVLDDSLEIPARDARQAELANAQAQLNLLAAGSRAEDVRATQAQLRAALATESLATRNIDREKDLMASGATMGARIDDVDTQLMRARSEREALEQRVKALRNGARPQEIDAAQARVAAAKAALAAAEERLSRFTLRAVADGRVLDVHVKQGEFAAVGAPVVSLADTHHPYVDIFVPQQDLSTIRVGTRAQARIDAVKDIVPGAVEHVWQTTEFTPRYLFSERERVNLVVRVRVRLDDKNEVFHAGVPAAVELQP